MTTGIPDHQIEETIMTGKTDGRNRGSYISAHILLTLLACLNNVHGELLYYPRRRQ